MGQPPALEQIFREHHTFVWRVVRRLGVAPAGVDDAVQEVFVVIHRRRSELDLSGSPRALLYGIARRVAKRHRDKAAQRASLSLVQEPHRDDPEKRVALAEAAAVVRGALDGMDEDKRMMFLLADVEGMSIPEVAACQGININTAYARLRAARALVHKAVARHRAREEGARARAAR